MQPLLDSGFTTLLGVDPSEALLDRARQAVASVQFERFSPPSLALAGETVDLALLFAGVRDGRTTVCLAAEARRRMRRR